MTPSEVLRLTREEYLDDAVEPYNWSTFALLKFMDFAIAEIVRECFIIKVEEEVAYNEIKLLSNVGAYALDSKIVRIQSARLKSQDYDDSNYTYQLSGEPLDQTAEDKLDATVSNWRNVTGTPTHIIPEAYDGKLLIYPKYDDGSEFIGVADVTFDAAGKTITTADADEDFTDRYEADDEIYISGTTNNNGYRTLATVTAKILTTNEALVNEAGASPTIRKVEDTLLLVVNRLPLSEITEANYQNASIEIPAQFHFGLMDGIAKRAYLKDDPECYDPKKANEHRLAFEKFKYDIWRHKIFLHSHPTTCRPVRGAI